LLPADFLRRVIDPKSKLEGLRPEDYGLPASERLNEVITQSWNRLRKHWTEFRAASESLPEREPGTGLTNDKWNLPLLRELGFGPLPISAGPEIAGRTYAINRFCGPVPIHLIGCGLSLDRRAVGVRGAAASNPHGLVQEFLNRSSGHVWAIVSNGLRLRILRDNQALSRQSFLEFDLETLFAGELYSDFVLLWLFAHATRFAPQDADKPDSCWLERWTKLAQEEGTRALTDLRGGVEKALQVLGQGFVSHPKNTALREALRTGEVKLSDFHGQLLRVVYRLIFLFVAEDRLLEGISLLHPQDKSEPARNARERYAAHYSSSRLRELASKIKGSRHGDLWRQFQLLVGALSGDERFAPMREALALPSLGSMLWNPTSTTLLNGPGLSNHQPSTVSHHPSAGAELTNFDLLEALRLLAFTRQGKILRPVDYKNLGSEEFGGVYESFLALTPQISSNGARFTFAEFAGNERKTSGSYYTPDSLVQCLLDSALDPVMEERLKEAKRLVDSGQWTEIAKDAIRYPTTTTHNANEQNKILSRSARVAEGDGPRDRVLSPDSAVSEGGNLRLDLADSSGGELGPSKHSGGLGTKLHQGVHSVPLEGERQSEGAGNASHHGPEGRYRSRGNDLSAAQSSGGDRQNALCAHWLTREAVERILTSNRTRPPSLPPNPYPLLAETALLSLKVCDKAVGSGHFLVGAAHRLARHLARIRAVAVGESEPSPLLYQTALRDVIGHCLYGVDINPMAVELCKVTLWLEALEPGKPLSFLDHHIRCGNSLLGATPELVANGIPDDAFKPIEGDDRQACSELKKRNSRERQGLGELFAREDAVVMGSLQQAAGAIDELPDDSPEAVHRKEDAFREAQSNYNYLARKTLFDTWCAAFVIRKHFVEGSGQPVGITQRHLNDLSSGGLLPEQLREDVNQLADQYQLFHFQIAFPEVFAQGDFDCSLGNPPWEQVELNPEEFFAQRVPSLANAKHLAAREQLMAEVFNQQPSLKQEYERAIEFSQRTQHFLHECSRYELSSKGRLNLANLFVDLVRQTAGSVGLVIPTTLATGSFTGEFFRELLGSGALVSLHGFDNGQGLFPTVKNSFRFGLLTLSLKRGFSAEGADFVFFAQSVADLRQSERHFRVSLDDLLAINPNTGTCPVFRWKRDAELATLIHRRAPVLCNEKRDESEDSWGFDAVLMFMTNTASRLFKPTGTTKLEEGGSDHSWWLPFLEAKAVAPYDHRSSTWDGNGFRQSTLTEKTDPSYIASPHNWIRANEVSKRLDGRWNHAWLLLWQDVTDTNTMSRTLLAMVCPLAACGDGLPVLCPHQPPQELAFLYGMLNSIVLDYCTRQKVGGVHLRFHVFQQLPVLKRSICGQLVSWDQQYDLVSWVLPRVLELTYTAWDLEAFAQDCGWSGPPFRWDEERRFLLRCELDAAFFHLYLGSEDEWRKQPAALTQAFPTPRAAVSYIMDTFPIVKRKDEAAHGTYRTKDTILEIYDALQDSIRTGTPYQTRLDPAPADPRCCHPPKQATIPMPTWMDRPLVVPTSRRVALVPDRYRATVVPHLLYQAGGQIPFERFRRAYWLLTEPKLLQRFARGEIGVIAQQWGRSFCDTLRKEDFIEHLKGAVKRQLHFIRVNGERYLELIELNVADDPYVIFDARLSLLAADLWPADELISPLTQTEEQTVKDLELVP